MPETYRFVIKPIQSNNARAVSFLTDAHALGLNTLTYLECLDIYFIQGEISQSDLQRLASELLSDPITQTVQWGRLYYPGEADSNEKEAFIVEVALHPGVTDPVAEQIVRAAYESGIRGVVNASTGFRYVIRGEGLCEKDLHRLARYLLANPTIHRYALGEIEPIFSQDAEASTQVNTLPVRELDDAGLLSLSSNRRAALDLVEMKAVQQYFQNEGRDPSDMEFEAIAQTWSEHCVHKTFKAQVTYPESGIVIDSILNTYLRKATNEIGAPWVRSAFVDNAGIIDFDDDFEVSFKVETHNHPSAIEPFGGANTGVGGVIRDILGVSAKPVANTDVLCFGSQHLDPDSLPEGVLHPRRIRSGVVAGVEDYGNKMGIPTVNGAVLYDPGYTANPLVFCGCVGLAPKDSHPRNPQPGDRVIVIGGRTGRDGLRGATFSSMTMDAQTGEVSGASVQIGNPIVEKGVMEVILRARDERLYHAITDCGAGGLSSAVGEMANQSGADVDLKNVRLKYAGLAPWEIWLSEAQERMVLAVPQLSLERLKEICSLFDVEWSDIGAFDTSGRLVVRYDQKIVLDLRNDFLHDGIPQRKLVARRSTRQFLDSSADTSQGIEADFNKILLNLLTHPNIASKEEIIRVYDHEVQGGTVLKPLTGLLNDGPSDGCVIKPLSTKGARGISLANGINPEFGKQDAYRMAWSAVDEAVRNSVAVGADPGRIALLDNFCWGDPNRPETLHSLVEAARGCHDAAIYYRTPFISGKDSLNNEYLGSDGKKQAIPPTLLISSIGIVEDICKSVTMDLKIPGSDIYLVGDFQPVWGGSHFVSLFGSFVGMQQIGTHPGDIYQVPGKPVKAADLYHLLHKAICSSLVISCHDLSEGGLAVAAAEMCIAGRLGIDLYILPELRKSISTGSSLNRHLVVFGETNGCFLVEIRPSDSSAFEEKLAGQAFYKVGKVTAEPFLKITSENSTLAHLPVSSLVTAWTK